MFGWRERGRESRSPLPSSKHWVNDVFMTHDICDSSYLSVHIIHMYNVEREVTLLLGYR